MAAAVGANKTNQAAAAASDSNANIGKLLVLDPQLLMAARRGDSQRIKELLRLNIVEDMELESHGNGSNGGIVKSASSSSEAVVILEVAPDDGALAAPAPAPPPPPPPPPFDDGVTTSEGDSLLHVVAACGDTQEYLDCAKMMVIHAKNKKRKQGGGGASDAAARLALEARNRKGDTPLHCAAGAGNASMISCLVDLHIANDSSDEATTTAVKAFLRMQNERGETALHQAIRAAADNNLKVACIDKLMAMDSELACSIPLIPHQEEDEEGASPLYLAISLGEVEIAHHLYAKSKGKLSYSGPDGRNVLHAAVHRAQVLPVILEEWLSKDMLIKPNKEHGPAKQCAAGSDWQAGDLHNNRSTVSRLTSQRDRKHKGSTPLHLAASLNGWPHAGFLSRRFPQVWASPKSVTTLLLDANESTAYQADDEGSYPIHVAAWSGSLGVVKLLLGRCPDCATLRDGKGRTFLHVAADKSSCHDVVEYACGEMAQQLPGRVTMMVLNAQDSNGDTALHGAVRGGNVAVFNSLFRNRQVRLDVANKDGMTPLDLSWTMIPSGFQYAFNPRNVVQLSLLYSGAPHGGGRPELLYEKHSNERNLVEESMKFTQATQVTSIVTALIATVAFASAFTLPGGYREDAAAGTPVLAGSYAFEAFVLADALAFICSMAATCTLVYAGMPALDIDVRKWYFNVSSVLVQSSARSLVAAFGLALYLVLAPVYHTTAVGVCAIVFATSLYGNMGARQIIRGANTARTRIGMRRLVVCSFATVISFGALVHFGSYFIIFGLPAILKLAR